MGNHPGCSWTLIGYSDQSGLRQVSRLVYPGKLFFREFVITGLEGSSCIDMKARAQFNLWC